MVLTADNDQMVIKTALTFAVRAHAVFLLRGIHLDRTNESSHMSKREERDFLARDPAKVVRDAITYNGRHSLVAKAGVPAAAVGATAISAVGLPVVLPILATLVFAGTTQALRLRAYNQGPGRELHVRFEKSMRRYLDKKGLEIERLFDMRSRDFDDLRMEVGREANIARHAFMRAFSVNQRLRLDHGCREKARTPQGVSALEAAIAVLEVASKEPAFALRDEPVLELDRPLVPALDAPAPVPTF